MEFKVYRSIKLMIALAAIVIFAGPVAAQSSESDPASFDIAGVKLGMTPDEAAASIKAFDPTLKITKQYLNYSVLSYGLIGQGEQSFSGAGKNTMYLNDLAAIKGQPYDFSQDSELIEVWFSHVLGQERVIAVQRTKRFHSDPKPAIASLRAGILAKYAGLQQRTFQFHYGDYTEGWIFGPQRQLLSPTAAKNKRLEGRGGMPQSVRAGDGIGLNVFFSPTNDNDQIAQQFVLTLYDGDGLQKSVAQSASAYKSLKAKADAQQLSHSGDAPPTKF